MGGVVLAAPVVTLEEALSAARGSRQRRWAVELTIAATGCITDWTFMHSEAFWSFESFKTRLADAGIGIEKRPIGPDGSDRWVAVRAPSVAHAHADRGWDITEQRALGYWRLDTSVCLPKGWTLAMPIYFNEEVVGVAAIADAWGALSDDGLRIARRLVEWTDDFDPLDEADCWAANVDMVEEAVKEAALVARAATERS
jgi:hypothetical protein